MKELIRKILKEEKMNPIKKFFFNNWDEMRSEGEYPTISKTTNVTGLVFYNSTTNGF
jgi:hypothetical protein